MAGSFSETNDCGPERTPKRMVTEARFRARTASTFLGLPDSISQPARASPLAKPPSCVGSRGYLKVPVGFDLPVISMIEKPMLACP
jgi:hypothetical protein